MEMAMAGNTGYLNHFRDDLKNHRFALIITEPLSQVQKEGPENFGAENNAWVKQVSKNIFCYYTPIKTLRATQVQLLAPNPDSKDCP